MPLILQELEALAPLIAVRGNNDHERWADGIEDTEMIRVGGVFVYIIHDLAQLDIDPLAQAFASSCPATRTSPGSRSKQAFCTSTPEVADPGVSNFRFPSAR